ncbi:MAG: type III-B CRISPR module RAMP protein Cmr6 [Gomphosphaeria aponina SAG 52.96 = DSM 107014]|uniref:Type III-B CRISPR module RAMP protein Cmr6 n=1 Tax=Gomphosphaeria aponina SAG 52.96 = DSM 107014 TaxID=1521640 RepID=A0A941GU22_9CHRO|nr:type III-B CRISPR module RAMP protein Cmr6 [Gomphosphaeria aponina SAG 52.96 = DSM 107014]
MSEKLNKPVPRPTQKSTGPTPQNRNNHGGNGGGGGKNNQPPSPWLDGDNPPHPHNTASFVEYLRWMREPEQQHKDGTKLEILHKAEQAANYSDRLKKLTQRTELIAGRNNTFKVTCPWRLRVGGHRGPESILLPAFDALGMPYIPSSSLRGVARCQAIREMTTKGVSWQKAEQEIAPYFGSLTPDNPVDKGGKVVFLDAYPLPSNKTGGLAMDLANNIWKWEGNELKYEPNPNPFFSLKEPTFLIGLRLASGCNEPKVLERVKNWLIAGLKMGIGSQINSGYGALSSNSNHKQPREFFRVEFDLEGQLIHGHQTFTQWKRDNSNQWQMRGKPEPEVRATAFKSMLRYWFRAFALGVLEIKTVKEWEAKLFGAITPKQRGWIRFDILEGKLVQKESQRENDECGEQEGILTLSYGDEAPKNGEEKIKKIMKSLTWLMFNLGGIGQGARRPCYKRTSPPWYRGAIFSISSQDNLWKVPETATECEKLFRKNLEQFYQVLKELTQVQVNYHAPRKVGETHDHQWVEAIDANCKIVLVSGRNHKKPFALELLHKEFHNLENNKKYAEAKSLCGGVKNDNITIDNRQIQRKVTPSPIWIADSEDYQIVTVFGANKNPRKKYLEELENKGKYSQLWPFVKH